MKFTSTDPASGQRLWEGEATTSAGVNIAVESARRAFEAWSASSLADRIAFVRRYGDSLRASEEALACAIAAETGKPLWEGRQEVGSMIAKIDASIMAQAERAGQREQQMAFGRAVLRHRPHGVMAVLGPYNFPGHLPNGHIIPALLAGDTVVFKPSEETPLVGEVMVRLWQAAGLPEGVLTLVQGGRETGAALVDASIDGLLFTGSAETGAHIRRALFDRPEVILALELGGNNPLIAWDGEPAAVASIVVASAFATAGQRCSCARRLIVPANEIGDAMVVAVCTLASRMRIGKWDDLPEPAIGPLISERAAAAAHRAVEALSVSGAKTLKPLRSIEGLSPSFVSPGVYDVTDCETPDAEIFAPLLQVTRVPDFHAAIRVANSTRYGLAGGLVSADPALWRRYVHEARAGVLNWNRPTTGASGMMPFGGVGASGNHRPSAFYAADYCAYPVASFEAEAIDNISRDIRGLET